MRFASLTRNGFGTGYPTINEESNRFDRVEGAAYVLGRDLMTLMRLCRGFGSADPTKLPNTAEEFPRADCWRQWMNDCGI